DLVGAAGAGAVKATLPRPPRLVGTNAEAWLLEELDKSLEHLCAGGVDFVVLDCVGLLPPMLPDLAASAVERIRKRVPKALVMLVGVDPASSDFLSPFPSCLGADFVSLDFSGWMGGCAGSQWIWADERHHGMLGTGDGQDMHDASYGLCAGSPDRIAALLSTDAVLKFWEEVNLQTAKAYATSFAADAAVTLTEALGTADSLDFNQELLGSQILVALPDKEAEGTGSLAEAAESLGLLVHLDDRPHLYLDIRMFNGPQDFKDINTTLREMCKGSTS
ncbi:unnamed protein product, partial [Polarella glacialis]